MQSDGMVKSARPELYGTSIFLTFAFGVGCGGCGTSCSASHTACIEMNCSLGVDKSRWHTRVTMETTQTRHFRGNKLNEVDYMFLFFPFKSSTEAFSWSGDAARKGYPFC